MSDGETRGEATERASAGPGTNQEDHLAVMARAGLMTHVAELAPPVTAEAMARFRAEAARQASNVMALASGRFALCLPPGRREVSTTVAHRLLPIGAAQDTAAPDGAEGAASRACGTPRRILPPSLRGDAARPRAPAGARRADDGTAPSRPGPEAGAHARPVAGDTPAPGGPVAGAEGAGAGAAAAPEVAAAPTPRATPGDRRDGAGAEGPPGAGEGGAPPAEARPEGEGPPDAAALARGQAALAEGLNRLAEFVAQAERRAGETAAAHERTLAALARHVEAAPGAAGGIAAPAGPDAVAGDCRTPTDGSGPPDGRDRIDDGPAPGTPESRLVDAVAEAVGTAETRLAEGLEASHAAQIEHLSDLRRRLEGVSAAQADESARLSEALATLRLGLRAVNDRLDALEAGGAGAGRAGKAPAAGGVPAELPPGPGRGDLHGAVQALLGRLDWLEAGAAAAAGRPDAPVWRRSTLSLRDEAG